MGNLNLCVDYLKTKNMGGLSKICKIHGSMKVNGVVWLWDYVNDKPRLKTEMTKNEILASEKAKWMNVKNELNKDNNDKRNFKS